ncbi:alpha/beta fold hydrolase [Variovorax sp. OV329]|uniref:alpha/beta fold hydrolase n=1 Tax=Variovorax sp. OV329 TaxID=1882825 RepID=UPI0008DF514B|nr:alpha/beta fold hydrolase [Variovorax sp. OV329]SFM76884.1 Serine aminopeptidase, S33 [Variovorax sp. OV329]
MAFHETAVAFGPEGTLIGVLTQPSGESSAQPGQVGCLLLNVGVNHRIGPRRLNVKAARQFAQAGIPCLRFDLSGIGDSRASGGREDFRAQALADMRAALDELQARTGISRFVVFGVCSGAANGLTLALGDPRVIGLTMFDGYVFPSKAVRIERKLRRWAAFPFNAALRSNYAGWRDWAAWAASPFDASARRKALGRLRGQGNPGSTEDTGIYQADAPDYSAPDFERDMIRLVERKVDLYLMFSATINAVDHDHDLMRDLRGSAFLPHVRYKFWPDIDHTATTLASQRTLLDEVCAWALAVARGHPEAVAVVARPPAQHAMPPQKTPAAGALLEATHC